MTQLGCKVHILFVHSHTAYLQNISLLQIVQLFSPNFASMMTGFGWGADKDVCFSCLVSVRSFFNIHMHARMCAHTLTHTHTVVVGIMIIIFQT